MNEQPAFKQTPIVQFDKIVYAPRKGKRTLKEVQSVLQLEIETFMDHNMMYVFDKVSKEVVNKDSSVTYTLQFKHKVAIELEEITGKKI